MNPLCQTSRDKLSEYLKDTNKVTNMRRKFYRVLDENGMEYPIKGTTMKQILNRFITQGYWSGVMYNIYLTDDLKKFVVEKRSFGNKPTPKYQPTDVVIYREGHSVYSQPSDKYYVVIITGVINNNEGIYYSALTQNNGMVHFIEESCLYPMQNRKDFTVVIKNKKDFVHDLAVSILDGINATIETTKDFCLFNSVDNEHIKYGAADDVYDILLKFIEQELTKEHRK